MKIKTIKKYLLKEAKIGRVGYYKADNGDEWYCSAYVMFKDLGFEFTDEEKTLFHEKNMIRMIEIKDYKQVTDSLVWNEDRKSDPSVSAYVKNIGKKIFFKNSNKTVCVQYKFVDFFGTTKEVFIKNPKSAVVIKEKNETVGYIMPIWIKESAAFESFKDKNKEFFEKKSDKNSPNLLGS